ncbi:TPA: hypothetical protein DIC38_01400 [Candidatus Nomurabacteria bacterium]|nr:MAG: hypothetical protein O210_OD1C00001G0450 [Parcubacteria bacterium RAAC4_OD1_1]HCY26322.1 hypothetical protein [Candidatus Nomurabacteria bacterium]
MEEQTSLQIQPIIENPLFDPTFLNMDYVFFKITRGIEPVYAFITNPNLWSTIGIISMILSLILLAIIIFSLVRMREIQIADKEEIEHEIHLAMARKKEIEKNQNPRWHYILTLIESPNESDWRVAIIEADSFLEEILQERGLTGATLSELLESAKDSGYRYIQDAWDAHLVRNQIAHEGSNFYISQIEGRKIVKKYQNFLEDLGVIA